MYYSFIFIFIFIFNVSSNTQFICPKAFGLFKNNLSCETFYECQYNLPVLKRCGGHLHFNQNTENCDWPQNAGCTNNEQNEKLLNQLKRFSCLSNGLFEDPNSCDHYIECNKGKAYRKNCPENLHFNEKIGACDWPNMKVCRKHVNHSKNTKLKNNPSILNHNKNNHKKPQSTDKTTVIITTIRPKVTSESIETDKNNCTWCFDCPKEDGYYSNQYDNQTYYNCYKGQSFLLYCPNNMIWDQNKEDCVDQISDNISSLINARNKIKNN